MDTEREDRSRKRCSVGLAVTRHPRCHTVCSGGSKSVYDGCDRVLDSAHGALPIVGESVKNNSQRLSWGAFGNFDLSGRRRRRRAQKETSVKAVTRVGGGGSYGSVEEGRHKPINVRSLNIHFEIIVSWIKTIRDTRFEVFHITTDKWLQKTILLHDFALLGGQVGGGGGLTQVQTKTIFTNNSF